MSILSEKKLETMHVGVIGAGMISHTYLDTLTSKFKIVKVDAISDLNPKAAQAASEKYGIPVATNEEIFQNPNIDIVLTLTPPAAHESILSSALNAGKHAYTEKCFALDTQTARHLCQLAKERGKYLGTAPDTFFSGWAQNARKIIDSGELGTITSFAMVGNRDNDRLLSAMAYLSKPGGGIILDYSVYYLTMLVNLLGPVKRVSATIKAPYPTHVNIFEKSPLYGQVFDTPNESQFYSILELENGITGTLSINADSVLLETPFGFQRDSRGVGLADMAYAIQEDRPARASAETALHVLDIQECMVKSNQQNSTFVEVNTTAQRALPLRQPQGTEESSLPTL